MHNIYYNALAIRAKQNGFSLENGKLLLTKNNTQNGQKIFLFDLKTFYCIGIIQYGKVGIYKVRSLRKAHQQAKILGE